jgi:hypothetical protein
MYVRSVDVAAVALRMVAGGIADRHPLWDLCGRQMKA